MTFILTRQYSYYDLTNCYLSFFSSFSQLYSVCSSLLRETKQFDFSHDTENIIMDSAFGKSFLFLTKLAWNCKVTLPVLVTAVFLAMDFRMQIELNIETEQLVFQVNVIFTFDFITI